MNSPVEEGEGPARGTAGHDNLPRAVVASLVVLIVCERRFEKLLP